VRQARRGPHRRPKIPDRLPDIRRVKLDFKRVLADAPIGSIGRTSSICRLRAPLIGPIACLAAALVVRPGVNVQGQELPRLKSASGLQLVVDDANAAPTLRLVLPDRSDSDRSIVVLFPEHVTVVRTGATDGQQLYLWQPGSGTARPVWTHDTRSLGYERDLAGPIHFTARATLDSDGVRFRYEFRNASTTSYAMITAITDPRLTLFLHDERLERTYVHYASGLDLLAAETPERLTMPLQDWLPARYLASFTWPVPDRRVERRSDGITYYNTSRRVDEPFIATMSIDKTWVVASFTRSTGNVWSNPELTCQHVDPQTALAPGATGVIEIKVLALRGSLDDAFQHMREQRNSLR